MSNSDVGLICEVIKQQSKNSESTVRKKLYNAVRLEIAEINNTLAYVPKTERNQIIQRLNNIEAIIKG